LSSQNFDERFGGDKRPIFRTSLVSGNPDLTRGSDVFYYFSAGLLPFDEGSPARNGELALSAADWKVISTERRASRSQPKRKSHTPGGDRNWSNRELWNGQWFSSPSWGNIARDERYILHTIKTGNHWPLMAICHQPNRIDCDFRTSGRKARLQGTAEIVARERSM